MFNSCFKYYKAKLPPPTFEDVFDFDNLDYKNKKCSCSIKPNIQSGNSNLGLKPLETWNILELLDHEGLIFIRNPFTHAGHRYWSVRCLHDFPSEFNRSNLDADPSLSIEKFWEQCQTNNDRKLLNKLRWVTLGYHHNWDTKVYDENSKSQFPKDLSDLTDYIARALGFVEFKAEAAIVNYYHMDSTLSGHTDHSEQNLEAPLFSFSFGQTAIFLLGGSTKEVKPTAMYLRSGDIVVMSKDSRMCYHGVPRIVLAADDVWNNFEDDESSLAENDTNKIILCENLWRPYKDYLQYSRININVRQVLNSGKVQLTSDDDT